MDFYLGDIHNGDENIIMYEHRPFENAIKMRNAFINNCNGVAGPDDILYLLGDIGHPEILKCLRAQIIIVLGNHDDEKKIVEQKAKNVIEINRHPIMVGGLWLSHEPIGMIPPECPYCNVHAHTHRFSYGLPGRNWNEGNRYFCVSAEQIGYKPISSKEIKEKLRYDMV